MNATKYTVAAPFRFGGDRGYEAAPGDEVFVQGSQMWWNGVITPIPPNLIRNLLKKGWLVAEGQQFSQYTAQPAGVQIGPADNRGNERFQGQFMGTAQPDEVVAGQVTSRYHDPNGQAQVGAIRGTTTQLQIGRTASGAPRNMPAPGQPQYQQPQPQYQQPQPQYQQQGYSQNQRVQLQMPTQQTTNIDGFEMLGGRYEGQAEADHALQADFQSQIPVDGRGPVLSNPDAAQQQLLSTYGVSQQDQFNPFAQQGMFPGQQGMNNPYGYMPQRAGGGLPQVDARNEQAIAEALDKPMQQMGDPRQFGNRGSYADLQEEGIRVGHGMTLVRADGAGGGVMVGSIQSNPTGAMVGSRVDYRNLRPVDATKISGHQIDQSLRPAGPSVAMMRSAHAQGNPGSAQSFNPQSNFGVSQGPPAQSFNPQSNFGVSQGPPVQFGNQRQGEARVFYPGEPQITNPQYQHAVNNPQHWQTQQSMPDYGMDGPVVHQVGQPTQGGWDTSGPWKQRVEQAVQIGRYNPQALQSILAAETPAVRQQIQNRLAEG